MFLIAGLGNPGREYADTRHNVGFVAADYLSARWKIPMKKLKFKAIYGQGRAGGEKIILAKPQTYMNASGESVRDMAAYFKIPPQRILVVYDEAALAVGRLRVRERGSDGGHNGVKSIIEALGSDEFVRVRIGVGAAEVDMRDHVLGKIGYEEGVVITRCIRALDDLLGKVITKGALDAMNEYNGKEF